MTISWPLTLPSDPKPSRVEWTQEHGVSVSQSPFTGETQTLEYDKCRWLVDVSYPPMDRDEAAPFFAFFNSLRGRRGTFYFGDTLLRSAQGAVGGTPLVKGASQTGFTVITDGWPNSTLVLLAGDFISIENHLHQVLADGMSDGSGNLTIDIWPRLRGATGPADNAAVTVTDARGIFRLRENSLTVVSAGESKFYALGFSAEEAL
ncbi:conserved hypothetical protein [Gammaproteobacteria bacterium]